MATEIRVPRASATMSEATLTSWLKARGETVRAGEAVLILETDKASVDVESPADGVLHPLVEEGQVSDVGSILGLVLAPGESPPASNSPASDLRSNEPTPVPGSVSLKAESVQGSERELRVTPAARRLARERNVNLAQVNPTGPSGRIVEADVERFLASHPGESATSSVPGSTEEVTPLSRMRRAVGERMVESVRTKPHFSLQVEVDASAMETLRLRVALDRGISVSYTAILVGACAQSLSRHPEINASLLDDKIVHHREVNVGVAVALKEGLLVPVVRSAGRKGLAELDRQIRQLQERAQQQHFTAEEVTGGTFTISNLGMLGIDSFTAIINPPESAILAVGRIAKRLIVVDDAILLRPMLTLTLSIDHRVLDGAQAAAFLMDIKATLENPSALT